VASFIERVEELVDRVMEKVGIKASDIPLEIAVPPGTTITITIRTELASETQRRSEKGDPEK
jgi:hypothetical protein